MRKALRATLVTATVLSVVICGAALYKQGQSNRPHRQRSRQHWRCLLPPVLRGQASGF